MPSSPAIVKASPAAGPAPLITIQPGPEGVQLDVHGMTAKDAIESLRLSLVHLVALRSDAPISRAVVSRQTAVALPKGRLPEGHRRGPGSRSR